ncbi:MAG: AAA family ATPase [Candidatus Desantisbacteria bacterium]
MAIEKIELKNFTVFENIEIEFCEGVNVLIGGNGTGKTHLLKIMYFFTHDLGRERKEKGFGRRVLIDLFIDELNVIRNLRDYKGTAEFSCTIDGNEESLCIDVSMNSVNKSISTSFAPSITQDKLWQENANKPNSVFIPAKEMLSHSKSLLALEHERVIPFDKTLIDIVAKAELGEANKIIEFQETLLATISSVIDGEVIYENDTFYMIKKNGLRIEFSMEADGLCKFGLLWKLIRNSLIEKDTILFWDEPEANINPQLIPTLVDVLLELQRNGVQIFLATHDYNLAKYFEVRRKENDKVLYHCLYKTDEGVKCTVAENYRDIQNNSIEMAFETLHNDIIDKAMEDVSNE